VSVSRRSHYTQSAAQSNTHTLHVSHFVYFVSPGRRARVLVVVTLSSPQSASNITKAAILSVCIGHAALLKAYSTHTETQGVEVPITTKKMTNDKCRPSTSATLLDSTYPDMHI